MSTCCASLMFFQVWILQTSSEPEHHPPFIVSMKERFALLLYCRFLFRLWRSSGLLICNWLLLWPNHDRTLIIQSRQEDVHCACGCCSVCYHHYHTRTWRSWPIKHKLHHIVVYCWTGKHGFFSGKREFSAIVYLFVCVFVYICQECLSLKNNAVKSSDTSWGDYEVFWS